MSTVLQLEIILLSISLLFIIIFIVRSGNISIRYSMVWIFSGILFLFFSLFPDLMLSLAKFLGFEVLSNMIFLIVFSILFLICISLTIIVTHIKEQNKLLIQEISILKLKVNNKK